MKVTAPLLWGIALLAAALLLGAVILLVVLDRNAGWPHELADLEGRWVLDRVEGSFESAPPAVLRFSPGSAAGLVRVSDGLRSTEFEIQGLGRFVFAEDERFEPLLASGASEVSTMTHLCPSIPAWDHLCFFPEGAPVGQDAHRKVITYERE